MATPLRCRVRRCVLSGLLALGAGAAVGCGAGGEDICGVRKERVMAVDGTAYRCTVAEDCPRPSRVFVCVTDRDPEQACVRCEQTVCERVIPEVCE